MTANTPDGPPPSGARYRAYVGPGLLAVCALHILVGIVDASPVLADAVQDGWAGAFTGERTQVLWYLMTGIVGVVAGAAITIIERSGRLPWAISITLLFAAGIGVSMAPASGFTLVLVIALLALARSWYFVRRSG